jgi:hypothetical protein
MSEKKMWMGVICSFKVSSLDVKPPLTRFFCPLSSNSARLLHVQQPWRVCARGLSARRDGAINRGSL